MFLGFYAGHYKKFYRCFIDEQSIILIYQKNMEESMLSLEHQVRGNALCRANDVTTHDQFPVKLEPGLELNKKI